MRYSHRYDSELRNEAMPPYPRQYPDPRLRTPPRTRYTYSTGPCATHTPSHRTRLRYHAPRCEAGVIRCYWRSPYGTLR